MLLYLRKAVLSSVSSYLERLLVLFGVVAMNLLHGLHVVLDVADSMLPCLESFGKQASSLFANHQSKSSEKLHALMTAHRTQGDGGVTYA